MTELSSDDRAGEVVSKSAERYWLLQYEDQALRFTRRDSADRWAAELAERGITSELAWHDEHSPSDTVVGSARLADDLAASPFEHAPSTGGRDGRAKIAGPSARDVVTQGGARGQTPDLDGAALYTASSADASTGTALRRWRAFALLVVAFFMTIVDLTIVNVALPSIGRSLHFHQADLQWVVTAYGLTFGGFLLFGGRAADLLGRRRLFMGGMALFTGASLACGLATSDTFLILTRGFQGLGAAVVLPAALSIVMNMFPEGAERNKALGIWGAVAAMGATIGVLSGGLFTLYAGWQYIFFLNVPIGVTALALAPKVVPESRLLSARRRYDPFGAASVTAALVVFVYAISEAPQVGWGATQTVGMLAIAVALVIAFLVVETRVEAPLLPLRLFGLRTVAGSNAVGFLLTASFFTFIFLGTLYMQQVLGYSALKTGLAWLVASLTSVACAGLSQMLVTKTSAKLVMAFGMALIGAGILWATQITTHGSFWHDLAGPFFVTGMGTAFAFIPVSIGALTGVTEGDAGVASGLLNTSQQLGGAIGVAVASSVAASQFRTLVHHGHGTAAALTGGFQRALWVCGLTGLVAIPMAFILIRRGKLTKAASGTQQGAAAVAASVD